MGMLPTLWSDMLFPAITSIQQDLGTSATAVQQTVSLFFVANAFMCLWHGVLSDAWGRRKPLLIGLAVLVLTSLLSLLATRIEHLWILRTVQGLVVGLGHILCRAVIRDLYSGEAAQKMIAHTSLLQSAGRHHPANARGLADVDVGLACSVCVPQRGGRRHAAGLRAQAARNPAPGTTPGHPPGQPVAQLPLRAGFTLVHAPDRGSRLQLGGHVSLRGGGPPALDAFAGASAHRRLPGLHPHDGGADCRLSVPAAPGATLGHATHPVPCLCRICLRQRAQHHAGRDRCRPA